jgi:hypothetical protein|tara:strand:- start:1824 stop:2144 length:321 start_codon:yes stop_codon:yes gene_type:complete
MKLPSYLKLRKEITEDKTIDLSIKSKNKQKLPLFKNKTEAVKYHLRKYGSITSKEAVELYGALRLSSIIYNLRFKRNWDIKSQETNHIDRYNQKIQYVKYIYNGNK